MLVLDLFGAVYVYKILRKYINKRIVVKKQQKMLKRKDNTDEVKQFKTTISDDIKFESEILCDQLLKMLDEYR